MHSVSKHKIKNGTYTTADEAFFLHDLLMNSV